MNSALYVMTITQIRHETAGRAYYQRKRAEGKGHKEALRCLKRRLADAVHRTMLRDRDTSPFTAAPVCAPTGPAVRHAAEELLNDRGVGR